MSKRDQFSNLNYEGYIIWSVLMTKYLVIANWKMNLSCSEANKWLDVFCNIYQPSVKYQVAIAPSFTEIELVKSMLRNKNIIDVQVYAQDISKFNPGAYTGEVGAVQLKDLGVSGVIIGHSERREYFNETTNEINEKINQAITNDLNVVVATSSIEQVLALTEHSKKFSLAFEPIEAIGTGKSENIKDVNTFLIKAKQILGDNITTMYGGSVDSKNIKNYLHSEFINGFIVGTASKDPVTFNNTLKAI